MDDLVRIASVSELPAEGKLREFPFGTGSVCIANNEGTFSVVDNVCPHKGGPLSEGTIENGKLVCPWHGWAFRLSNGQCVHRPGVFLEIFELVIRDEDVFLKP